MKIGLVASKFNALVVERLVQGALGVLWERGLKEPEQEIIWVPGALEIPIVAQQLLRVRQYDALICFGAVIKGSTAHYEHVSREVHHGIMRVSLDAGIPISLAILTTDNLNDALERAGGSRGNLGLSAAIAAVDQVQTLQKIKGL